MAQFVDEWQTSFKKEKPNETISYVTTDDAISRMR